ncbi:MAG: pantoate--beta-alanine ligase [Clostridiaceae bacterium]
MKIIRNIEEMKNEIVKWKKTGGSIGLVPTMGFLHEGHESLIKRAVSENDHVVVYVFVNPLQFGPNEDFAAYPRDLDKDAELCTRNHADVLFTPDASELYYKDAVTYVNVEKLTEGLCGAKRPGHFQGVCTVLTKFFNIVKPDRAYFGEKDAQQLAVVKRMARDLNFDTEIVGCPIVREKDGLAKSSRNNYLSPEERVAALVLFRSLLHAKEYILSKDAATVQEVKNLMLLEIMKEPLARVDYIEIVDSENLKESPALKGKILVALAVFIGRTRLIDNLSLEL